MRTGFSPDLQKRLNRPDPRARVIVQAETVTRGDTIQRKDHWADADALTGFRSLDDGRLTLAPSTSTPLSHTTGTTNATDMDRAGPITVGLIQWGGSEPRTFRLNAITARLDPDVASTGALVDRWVLQLFRVAREGSVIEGNTLEPICAPLEVSAGASAADVTFSFPAGAEPQPKLFGPPEQTEDSAGLFTDPTTVVMIWAIDADGDAAGNTAWVMDGTTPSKTTALNFLTAYDLSSMDGIEADSPSRWSFAGAAQTPRISVVIQTFSAATVTFSTNPLDLGATPTGDVRFSFLEETPGDTTVTYEVQNDAASAWVAVTSGQTTDDLTGVGKRQTYAIRATLDPGTPANKTPAVIRMAVEEVTTTDFDGLAEVAVSGWQIDPLSLRGSICEATIRCLKDGAHRDYRDKATALVASTAANDIAFNVYVGWKDSDSAVQGLLVDTFDVDDYRGEGAAMVFTAVGRNARLRAALPVYDTVADTRELLAYENATLKAAYDDILGTQLALDDRLIGPGIEDATTQVTKEITDSDVLAEAGALAELAGGGVISSQGRVKFRAMHGDGGEEVVAVFRSGEIQPMDIGPGLRARSPQVYVPWDYDFEAREFGDEKRCYSANALLDVPEWKIDRHDVNTETCKWIDTSALAETVGTRIVQTMGTGLILWRFRSLVMRPDLEPGDLVAVETDRFAARDPNGGRAIRGQVFALARVQRVGDIAGTDFTVWVQSYADIQASVASGTRVGFARPEITAVYTGEQTATTVVKTWTVNEACGEVWLYQATAPQGTTDPLYIDANGVIRDSGGSAVIPAQYDASTITEHTFAIPDTDYITYFILEPHDALLFAGDLWWGEIHPLPPAPPVVRSATVENGGTGTVFVKFTERGYAVASVEAREKSGNVTASSWVAMDRGVGSASTVNGGTLGSGEYEHDVPLALSRFSFITVRYTLDTGDVFYLEPFPFDRNLDATIWTVEVNETDLTVDVVGDTDTVSLGLERVDGGGSWSLVRDGRARLFDLTATDDDANSGMGASDQWTVRVHALAVPAASVTLGTTASDTQDHIVKGSSAASVPIWEAVSAAPPPTNGSAVITLTLDSDYTSGTYTTKVERRYDEGVGWSAWSDITSGLSPSLTTPPSTSTDYSWTSSHGLTGGSTYVTYEFRCEILDGSSTIVATQTARVSYGTGISF